MSLGALGSLTLAASCGGQEFTANGTPSEGGGGSGGVGAGGGVASSEAGESGSVEAGSSGSANGGSSGDDSNSGSGGKAPVVCDCHAGQYCQDGTGACKECAEFGRFQFGPAQKLTTLAQSTQSNERFARPAAGGAALFYVSGAADSAKIWYAAAPASGAGVPVTTPLRVESGPLYLSGAAEHNLFFDRRQAGERKLMMAFWTAPALLTNELPVPGMLNVAGADDYSIAISRDTGHVYWMSTRNGAAELLWQPTSMSSPPAPAVLDLKLKVGSHECARGGEDATPWVNVSGTLLLFRNPSLNDGCEPNDAGATDLFAAPLDQQGLPVVPAIPLASLNNTGGVSTETDPSLSPDSCFLYFASDNGTGNFDLYKAQRN